MRILTIFLTLLMATQALAQTVDSTMSDEFKRIEAHYKKAQPVVTSDKQEQADQVVVIQSDKTCVNEKQAWDEDSAAMSAEGLTADEKKNLKVSTDGSYKNYEECLTHELNLKLVGEVEDTTPKELTAPVPGQKKKTPFLRNIYAVSGMLMAVEIMNVAIMTQAPSSVTGWHGKAPHFEDIKRSFTMGPRIDQDHWYWNYLGHPVNGAEYYLIARNRGFKWWQAFLYSAGQSAFWEFGPEAVYERASVQDLIITPFVGSLLGEGRYQLKKFLVNKSTGKADKAWKKLLLVIIDPVDAITGGLKAGYHPAEYNEKK